MPAPKRKQRKRAAKGRKRKNSNDEKKIKWKKEWNNKRLKDGTENGKRLSQSKAGKRRGRRRAQRVGPSWFHAHCANSSRRHFLPSFAEMVLIVYTSSLCCCSRDSRQRIVLYDFISELCNQQCKWERERVGEMKEPSPLTLLTAIDFEIKAR